MSTLTTAQLLAPPEGIARQAEAAILAAESTGSGLGGESNQLSDGLKDPEVKKRAYEEIKALTENARSARASFNSVTNMVRDVDALVKSLALRRLIFMMPGPPEQQTPPLQPKWSTITQNFDTALKASIQVVPPAIQMMKTVQDILDSAGGKPVGDLQTRLQTFMLKLKDEEIKALQLKNQFQVVADGLRTFWADIEVAFQAKSMAQIRNAVVQDLGKRIGQLTAQLEALQQKLAALSAIALRQTTSGSVGASMLFFQLCPSAFLYWMSRAHSSSVGGLFTTVEQEMEATQNQIAAARHDVSQVQQQQAILYNPKFYLNDVAVRVDCVVNIWQTINLDMYALKSDLESNISPDAPVTKFLLAKMKVSKELYGNLVWLLEQYVDQMNQL